MFSKQSPLRSYTRNFRRGARRAITEFAAGLRARLNRTRLKGKMVAVTGSSGKSSAVSLLAHVLGGFKKTHSQVIENTFVPVANSIASAGSDCDFYVLEAGATIPGSIKRLAKLIRPDVAVVTMFNIEHRAAFKNIADVAAEKAFLVQALGPGGMAVLNADDLNVAGLPVPAHAQRVIFGMVEEADYRVSNLEFSVPGPLRLTITSRFGVTPLEVPFVGAHFWVSIAAAFATAAELGVPPDVIAARCASFSPLEGRSRLINLDNGISFLADTAKSPWHSFETALKPLETVTGRRRIAIIGQISDYSGASSAKYRKAYQLAKAVSEVTIFVGEYAHKANMGESDLKSGRAFLFPDIASLHHHLESFLEKGDFVFLKSGSILHLERLAFAQQGEVNCWIDKCRLSIGCTACGLYGFPYETHPAIRKKNKFSRRLKAKLKSWFS